MKELSLSVLLTLTFLLGYSQKETNLSQRVWSKTIENNIEKKGERWIIPKKYKILSLDFNKLKNELSGAPVGYGSKGRLSFSFPTPFGTKTFKIVNTPIFTEETDENNSLIQTFTGYNIDSPSEWIKLDYSILGFHAMIFGGKEGRMYIDPYQKNDTKNYIVYSVKDLEEGSQTSCDVGDLSSKTKPNISANKMAQGDCQLRTYRIAIATTGEFTAFYGSAAATLAGISTTMNRVNGIYEESMGITMAIVANNINVIYTNGGTDPFTDGNAGVLINQSQTELDATILDANYDIGQVWHSTGSGLAQLNAPCRSGQKGRGVSGHWNPASDDFAVGMVCHELGHQYGASHSYNNGTTSNCVNRDGSNTSTYEPGSGSTIMSYAGICGAANVQADQDDYFHAISISSMSNYVISSFGDNCPVKTSSSNSEPVTSAGSNYEIPEETPFQLTGSVTDADGADVHTYCWEQYDPGPSAEVQPSPTSTGQPNFRSFPYTTSPTRYFPQLSDILAGNNSTQWEMMPTVDETMTFRLTVRDNSVGGYGCSDSEDMTVSTNNGIGPFIVTYPNAAAITWTGGASETVLWNVANTTNAPVSCANVDVLLSTDGGLTFPYTLASNVTNDGSQAVTVPNLPTTTARVKIICNGNIFFDISNNDFTISAAPITTPDISFVTTSINYSESTTPDGNLDCRPYKDYTVTMEIANAPTGDATVTINPSGTATNGLDYTIISSPLTFADGVTTNQSFTIRIFDDAIVDGAETATLSFNITGSTDAIAGGFNQTCIVSISDNDVVPTPGGASVSLWTEDFSSGFTGDWTVVHLTSGQRNTWSASTCLGQEINGNSAIIIDNDNGTTYCGYWVYGSEDPIYFYREVNAVGYKNISANFNWKADGQAGGDYGELIYSTDGGTIWNNVSTYQGQTTTQAATQALPSSLNNSVFLLGWRFRHNGDGVRNSDPSFSVDDIDITATPGVSIETVVTVSSDNQYLGPNQSVYFYNPTDGDLMAYIQNTSAHNYGCTTVEVDRAGTGATQFQTTNTLYDVTDKTYRIIPTTNNITGTYDATFYYSEAEIAGWETATGNVRGLLEMVKTSSNISNVTPANREISTTVFTAATIGAFGGDVTISSSSTTGFSGIGLARDAGLLSIDLLNFVVEKVEKVALIKWKVASPDNFSHFEIEKSYDSKNFEFLKKVNFVRIQSNYNYNDYRTKNGANYYRLKMIDNDGSYSYSQIKKLVFEKEKISLYPNPFNNNITFNGLKSKALIKIVNVIGQVILEKQLVRGDNKIQTSDLSDGTYFVTIQTENNTFVEKLIKSTK